MEFSPDGNTLSTAGDDNRVTIRRLHDIIPQTNTQDNHPFIFPSPPSLVSPISHPSPLFKDPARPYTTEDTDAEELRLMAEGQYVDEVGDPERPIQGDAAGFGGPAQRQPIAGAFIPRGKDSKEDNESARADSSTVSNWGSESDHESAAGSSSRDSDLTAPGVEPTLVDSSLTITERGASRNQGWPSTRQVQKDANSVLEHADDSMTMTTTAANAGVEAQPRPVEENAEGPACAIVVAESPLDTAGEAEHSGEAPCGSVQGCRAHAAEEIPNVPNNRWREILGAIAASSLCIARRVANGGRKCYEKMKKLVLR
ncbi:hypothetical protein GSI_08122 [Ganoderma sinense ZZ0214-1]|uniref:Uncharacterized protein n=1 Tax=Ganoderma sinense ZZ0214-1 TaxID=1077348 RepID=A0A2G8S7H1_9APHY|nr:hypothetical protein GSI_08122 [Ganoderma sinense ZZ0214-1]